jgi:hypothetical protein
MIICVGTKTPELLTNMCIYDRPSALGSLLLVTLLTQFHWVRYRTGSCARRHAHKGLILSLG